MKFDEFSASHDEPTEATKPAVVLEPKEESTDSEEQSEKSEIIYQEKEEIVFTDANCGLFYFIFFFKKKIFQKFN